MQMQKPPTVDIGGKTYNVKLEVVDNESSNDKAVSAASNLISKNVSIILGSYGSGVSIAASDTFAQAKIPAVGVTCTNPPRSRRAMTTTSGSASWTPSRVLSWPTLPRTS